MRLPEGEGLRGVVDRGLEVRRDDGLRGELVPEGELPAAELPQVLEVLRHVLLRVADRRPRGGPVGGGVVLVLPPGRALAPLHRLGLVDPVLELQQRAHDPLCLIHNAGVQRESGEDLQGADNAYRKEADSLRGWRGGH